MGAIKQRKYMKFLRFDLLKINNNNNDNLIMFYEGGTWGLEEGAILAG